MSLFEDKIVAGIRGIDFEPEFFKDKRFKVWICALSPTTCKPCFDLHGKLFLPENAPPRFPELHENCLTQGTCNTGDGVTQGTVLCVDGNF